MRTFSVNEKNDLFLDASGNISISTALDAIKYVCENTAKGILGEMIFDEDRGLPYFESIFVGSPNVDRFISSLRRSLRQVSGVNQISEISTNIENNVLTYSAVVSTDFGSTAISN